MRTELSIQFCEDSSPPEPLKPGRKRSEAMYEALGKLVPGGGPVEVNRHRSSLIEYARRFGREAQGEVRFMVRTSRPGWSKIWRVK
jgi:hypothetical protein